MVFNRFKKMMGGKGEEETSSEFIEIDFGKEKTESKILVKTFVLKVYEDINPILNALREGYTIAIIDIKPLKQKDVVELKRAISKVKKTVEALEGKIAGFGENVVIATPSKVFEIQKGSVDIEPPKRDDSQFERF
jgi:SepF-like predicted cell division protein (DUF552 family)